MSNIKNLYKFFFVLGFLSACSTTPLSPVPDPSALAVSARLEHVKELSGDIAIFDEVAFGLGLPLRQYLNETGNIKGKMILDLGAGAGVLSLIALKNGAEKAVATDINPNAVANAIYNAQQSKLDHKMEARLVSTDNPGAYSVIGEDERFDFIVSNPPQIKAEPKNYYEYSYNDPELSFLRSIIEGLGDHLTPEGKGVFALYDIGLEMAKQIAEERGLGVNIHLKTRNQYGNYHIVEITRGEKVIATVDPATER